MSMLSKLREARLGLRAGVVTHAGLGTELPVPERFRGRPVFDAARCTGCAGCANNCPARAILVRDVDQELRVLSYVGRRCTYCGRCADVCPEGAVTMSHAYELATGDADDLRQRVELFMASCQRCGRCFQAPAAVDALKLRGYRADDLEGERWVPEATARLPGTPPEDLVIELED